jgi:hypothetical protein
MMQNLRSYARRLDSQTSPATLQQFLSIMTKEDNFPAQQGYDRRPADFPWKSVLTHRAVLAFAAL